MFSQTLYIWINPTDWTRREEISLPNEQIQQISIGEKHIIVRTSDRILATGKNTCGQLGLDDHDQHDNKANFKEFVEIVPKFIKAKIRQVSCGWNHTLILDERGCVYSAGDGKNGALGYGRGRDSYEFKPVSGNISQIAWISAGKDHSLALSSTKVYGWGNSMDGQLGLPRQKIFYDPQQLFAHPASLCFAGPKYSIFVSPSKGIYVTGYNDKGQLGLGHQKRVKLPRRIVCFQEQVIQVSGSSSYTVFKTINNEVYIAGSGCFGSYLYHTRIKHFKNCEDVLFGEEFGMTKDQNGDIYSWHSHKDSMPVPNQQIKKLNIDGIFVGPHMIICNSIDDSHQNLMADIHQCSREMKSPTFQKKQGMIQSSKDWSNNLSFKYQFYTNSIPNSIENRRVVNIRNSQEPQTSNNTRIEQIEEGNQQEQYQEYIDNFGKHRIRFHQKRNTNDKQNANSPFFRKQGFKGKFAQGPFERSNRISCFESYEQDDRSSGFNPSKRRIPNNISERRSIETISEEPNASLCPQNKTTKTLAKQVGSIQRHKRSQAVEQSSQSRGSDLDIMSRLRYLENQNQKKTEYIKKMRNQLVHLMDTVQEDEVLRRILERKGNQTFLSRYKQLRNSQYEEDDAFQTNLQQIRTLLTTALSSLNYSQ